MILKALYDYYNRSLEYDPNSLPRYGTMEALISFIIVIDIDGNYVRLEDARHEDGKGRKYILPKGEHNAGKSPLLFWDNCMYALGYSNSSIPLKDSDAKDPAKLKKWNEALARTHEKHEAFVEQCKLIAEETQNQKLMAVYKFYANGQLSKLMSSKEWKLIKENPSANVSFQIEGDTQLVATLPLLKKYVKIDSDETGICLITGEKGPIVRKVTPAPLPLRGCQASASLVTFQKNYGFDSYGKSQAYNAPISPAAEFAFSTAYKKLIESKSRNNFKINNDRLYVFFASNHNKESEQIEDLFFDIFQNRDNPNLGISSVRKKLKSIFNGHKIITGDDWFYIMGIASNKGREAVVYYVQIPINEFAKLLDKHFKDMEIVAPRWRMPYCGLYQILRSVCLNGDVDKNCPPNLPDAIVKSIFQGLPYPQTLFSSTILRIRAEQDVFPKLDKIPGNPCRVAIIKAYLNRLNDTNNKKISTMLDKDNQNQGYLCGRLFAVLENLQFVADERDSIRAGYMNAASSTPSAVFPTILKLSNSHYSKLLSKGKKGLANYFDKQKKEIIAMIQDFPDTLDLRDQGRFFIGYYHQKNYKESKETEQL